ncbi:MAG: phosphatase PAP2 family protein [Candidatus Eisenbacteria bacterium]|uniref:Phosphatase PAP2 family protein n=1 Tax=Eiseniibacteriota bacterium TaxID=2212470 RepID=A0A849SPE7_UNCEI|nr:phosphatase PAP2 family protein [Candidatus Eisenbacteria bacterium]
MVRVRGASWLVMLALMSCAPAAVSLAAEAVATPDSAPERPADHALHPIQDVGNGLRAFGSDAWSIASSPARINRRAVLWIAGTAAVTAVIYNHDEAITRAALRNQGDPTYDAVLDVGYSLESLGLMGKTAPFYLGALGIGYAFRVEPLTVIPAQILESHLIAGGVRNLSKLFIGRRRPFENQGPEAFEFDGGTSFPSGHTSVVFELATILSHHANRWPVTVATYALATTVAIQRVDSRSHWASDVVVPAVTGTLIARTIVRRHDARAMALVPTVSANGAPGLKASFGF